jgi:hypothetical protein
LPAGVTASRGLVKLLSELVDPTPLKSMSPVLPDFLLSNCRLPRDFKLWRIVVHPDESWRGLKKVVQPSPQIAIEEQLLPQ